MVHTSELRIKDVVSVADGRRLGAIVDLDLDLEQGTVASLILPGGQGRLFGLFGRPEEIVIPWHQVERVGVDVILVRLPGGGTSTSSRL